MHTSPSGKKYIGMTGEENLVNRWGLNGNGYLKHKPNGEFNQPAIANAILKYNNWDNWKHEILLSELTQQEAEEKEIELIELHDTTNPLYGYNIRIGGNVMVGENNPNYGKHHSEETRKKISDARKGKLIGEDNPMYGNHRFAGENHPLYGTHLSQDTKDKIGKALTGREMPEEIKRKISEKMSGENNPMYDDHRFVGENSPWFGKKHTEETKEKMRLSKMGKCPVYCIELDELFYGVRFVTKKYGFDAANISSCCRGKSKYAYKHPVTNEPLHWKYVYDQDQNDKTVIMGAITLGYITEKRVNNYLEDLRQKGNDI